MVSWMTCDAGETLKLMDAVHSFLPSGAELEILPSPAAPGWPWAWVWGSVLPDAWPAEGKLASSCKSAGLSPSLSPCDHFWAF